jgi:hypothetical protein
MVSLDDSELRVLVREAADAIDVPAEGPERVLALRDEAGDAALSGRDSRWRTNRGLLAAAAVVVIIGSSVAVLASRGGSPARKFASVGQSLGDQNGVTGAGSSAGSASTGGVAPGAAGGTGAAGGPATFSPPAVAAGPATPAPPPLAARVIKTGSLSLVVPKGRLSLTVNEVTDLTAGLGGYVSETKTAEGGNVPTADLTLRVPGGQFETLLGRARTFGKPTSLTTSGQDVTAQYVDLAARLHALEATRDQFLQILAKASQIGDILNVENQLTSVQTQIEELQGQQRVLDDQTTYGTLTVHLGEQGTQIEPISIGPLKGPSGWATAWRHARHSFAHGIQSVVAASGGIAIFILTVALLAFLARLAWTLIRRRLV